MAHVSRRGRPMPETPDIVGLLRSQVAVTLEGLDMFVAWAEGDGSAAATLPDVEHRGDATKANAPRRAARRVRDPLGARGRVRAVPWR